MPLHDSGLSVWVEFQLITGEKCIMYNATFEVVHYVTLKLISISIIQHVENNNSDPWDNSNCKFFTLVIYCTCFNVL